MTNENPVEEFKLFDSEYSTQHTKKSESNDIRDQSESHKDELLENEIVADCLYQSNGGGPYQSEYLELINVEVNDCKQYSVTSVGNEYYDNDDLMLG